MIDTLAKWEYTKNVKVTLKNGEIVYCDLEDWIDDDPEGISIMPNSKTTNDWLIGRIILGSGLDITEIENIEKLSDNDYKNMKVNNMPRIYCKGTIKDVIEYEYDGELEHVHGVKLLENYKIKINAPYAKLLIDEIPEKIYAYFVFPQVYDEEDYNDFIVWIPQLFSDYYSLFCCYEDEIKYFIKYLKELDVDKISDDEEYEDLDYFTRLHINGNENNELELDMHSGAGQGTNYILFGNVKLSSLKKLGNDLEKAYKKVISNSNPSNNNVSVKKGEVVILPESSSVDVDRILNESEEFKNEMERIKATGKNLCAFVSFYKNGGGKTYTYLVDAYYHGGRWFVEDTDKEVFVMEFGELADDELPVSKDKMKHLRWNAD